ncbi:MAG: hypothetical protein Q4B28_01775 [bacterium]|nr:hypothetical protein [bacterium]
MLVLSQDFWTFYKSYQLSSELVHPIKVLYSNIYKDNQDYADILSKIKEEKPDILLFVEFEAQHREVLKPQLLQAYPYILRGGNSSLVASKYPLEQFDT